MATAADASGYQTELTLSRRQLTFAALVIAQAAHSLEEYVGRLWESFPPARFLTGLLSQDRELGFIIINVSLVAIGAWCFWWPVRRAWPSAALVIWLWVGLQGVNSVGHLFWALRQRGYTAGVATAPVLLVLALTLAWQLRAPRRRQVPHAS